MIEEENKAYIRHFVHELWGRRNLDIIDELCAPNFLDYAPLSQTPLGLKEFKQVCSEFHSGFADSNFIIHDIIAEGDRVVWRWTNNATHKGGSLMGVPESGKRLSITGITIDRFFKGKIEERWDHADILGFRQQLGLVSPEIRQSVES